MERGFTLVEIAIVVLVLGLLLGSLLGPLSVRIEQQEIQKTSDQMEEIKEALYGAQWGFAMPGRGWRWYG